MASRAPVAKALATSTAVTGTKAGFGGMSGHAPH